MALIDELLKQVSDRALRRLMEREIATLRERIIFGLIFEKHIPENAVVPSAPIRVGSLVQRRDDPNSDTEYIVESLEHSNATVRPTKSGGTPEQLPRSSLAALKRLGEPDFPGLRPIDRILQSKNRPYHAVINGENYHTLQLLSIFGPESVDCLYLDPPYNSGAADWKYNNRFVDKKDGWRHSKWLSMMERRLRVARSLLKPDGVVVVAIDENEHAHLVCLLEQMFVGWEITSVAIIHNPRGIQGDNFSPNNDFAVFVTPPNAKVIARRSVQEGAPKERRFRTWGAESERRTAKNCFYPIYVQEEGVVGFGDVPPDDFHPNSDVIEVSPGRLEVWPIDNAGIERKWMYQRKTVPEIAHLLSAETVKGKLQIRIDKETAMHKTVWSGSRYDSGSHGKRLLSAFGIDFDFPKSLYTMRDVLYACTKHRKDALILDYFAGSGTTLHATCLLNSEDDGQRRCILVTNNEVSQKQTKRLHDDGLFLGDKGFEEHGIFQAVTHPRCKAAITGFRPDGQPVLGEYETGRLRSEGFEENVEFFELVYLDPDDVELGKAYDPIHPLLWLSAGAKAKREERSADDGMFVDEPNNYAVLMNDARIQAFVRELAQRSGRIKKVFHVTNAPEAFAELVEALGPEIASHMLFRDYLSACQTHSRVLQ